LDVVLYFVEYLEVVEMRERLGSALQLVIDTIFTTKKRQILQRL
jgi:hypothetical protein